MKICQKLMKNLCLKLKVGNGKRNKKDTFFRLSSGNVQNVYFAFFVVRCTFFNGG